MSISLLNLDTTYPVADSYHETNTSGVIRYVNASDANGLASMQRYMGDAFHRVRLIEDKINSVIGSFNANPYTSGFDDSVYVKTSGANAITGVQIGVTPTATNHLATKGYIDTSIATVQASVAEVGAQVGTIQAQIPLTRVSDWVPYVWSAGSKTHLTFTLTPAKDDISDVALISIIERLNTGTEEEPSYTYMQYVAGNSTNFKIDAMWLSDSDGQTLNVLVANDVFYPGGYPESSGYNDIQEFSERALRAVVVHASGAC
jgi:hypothetical protein